MDITPERHETDVGDFQIPFILLRASRDGALQPCLNLGNGSDRSQEEMLHIHGFPALERGYDVVLYEGAGQTTVIRGQRKGFVHDWERVITPIVDWLWTLPFIEKNSIALLGVSLRGYLAMRAACFVHRLAAVILNGGIFDVSVSIKSIFGEEVVKHDGKDVDEVHKQLEDRCQSKGTAKWLANQIKWAWKTTTPYDVHQESKKITLEGIIHQARYPVLVCDAEHDSLVTSDQPPLVAQGLGKLATYRKFTSEESADAHCHLGGDGFRKPHDYVLAS
jgi:predicted esterase YcpF (UPF0227 family)